MTSFLTGKKIHTLFVGIDNGSSGSIGMQGFNAQGMKVFEIFLKTPTVMEQDYTKKKQRLSLLDHKVLRPIFRDMKEIPTVCSAMERPMTGKFLKQMLRSARLHQQWMDYFRFYNITPPIIVDSQEWQKTLLPKGIKGSDALKKASLDVGQRLFHASCKGTKHSDCDGMFICELVRRRHTLA